MMPKRDFHIYCVANDARVLARDLRSSPDIASGAIPLSVLWNQPSASAAYAKAIRDHYAARILIFAHQDIFFPQGWFDRLAAAVDHLEVTDPEWAIAGIFGVTHTGCFVGHVWDSGLGRVCGSAFSTPTLAASLDEIVLIVRQKAGVCFDPALPGFHLYGTDIVLEAERRGKTAYVLDLPAIHNSKPVRRLGRDYAGAYRFMVHKWRDRLPRPTVILTLTVNPWPLVIRRVRTRYKAIFRASMLFDQLADPASKALELGFSVPGSFARIGDGHGCDQQRSLPSPPWEGH